MSPYGDMLVEHRKSFREKVSPNVTRRLVEQGHGSLIFPAFVTRRLVEQGHGSLIFLVWATQEGPNLRFRTKMCL